MCKRFAENGTKFRPTLALADFPHFPVAVIKIPENTFSFYLVIIFKTVKYGSAHPDAICCYLQSFEADLGYNVRWPSTSSYVVLREIIADVSYC